MPILSLQGSRFSHVLELRLQLREVSMGLSWRMMLRCRWQPYLLLDVVHPAADYCGCAEKPGFAPAILQHARSERCCGTR
jgi:hypothetical protein